MKFLVLILFVFTCVLSRAQNTLAGTLTIQKWMKLQGDLPVSVTGSQNNFNPTGLDVSGILYLTANADLNITGIVPTTTPTGNDGRILAVFNVDSADTITLVNQSASSTAANRMSLGTDVVLTPNGPGIWLIYDTNISRWRVFGGSGGSSGGGGSGVTSVGLDLPSSVFDITGSPVTTTGTLTGSFKTQTANRVFAGPASGIAAAPTFRALVALDIPDVSSTYLTVSTASSTYLTQTNAASTYQPLNAKLTSIAALTSAAGWLHNNGSGTFAYSAPTKSDVGLGSVENTALSTWGGSTSIITLGIISAGTWQGTAIADTYISSAATWNAKGTGSVTSVSMTVPSFLSIAGSPVTTSGTLAVTLATQSANLVFAGPSSGSAAAPTFRSLVVLDVPTLNQNTTGSAAKWTTSRNLAGNSVNGSADVAFANNFIMQGTTDAGLSAAQFLGALGTGILKNTTTTGVLSIAVAADFPTLNQSTTGSAATLTTARLINSVSFNGSIDITVTAAAGTLTGTTLNSTVVTSSLTAVGTITTGTWLGVTIAAAKGGTGFATYAVGDLLYADTGSSLAKLAGVATGNALISGGVTTAPSWGKIGLTTHVSGTLAAGNGGTGLASYTVGDLLYASTTSALSSRAAVATGQVLISQGTSTAPIWSGSPTLSGKLTVAGSTTDSSLVIGGIEIQSYAVNNEWLASNTYFNGTNFKYRANGFSQMVYFDSTGTIQFRLGITGTAGGTVTQIIPGQFTTTGLTVAGKTTSQASTMSSPIGLGAVSTNSTYGLITFNNVYTLTGALGIFGGDVTDNNCLYSATISGGRFDWLVAGTSVTTLSSTGVFTLKGAGTGGELLVMQPATTTSASYMRFQNTGGAGFIGEDNSTGSIFSFGNYIFNIYAATDIVLSRAAAERLRITSTGMTINAAGGWSGNVGASTIINGANAALNGGGLMRIASTDTATINLGASIVLGGFYNGTSTSIDFAEISGRKENSTAGNTQGYLSLGVRPNGGNMTEIGRFATTGLTVTGALSTTGNALFGTSTDVQARVHVVFAGVGSGVTPVGISIRTPNASASAAIQFVYTTGPTEVGSITTTSTATSFNTSSDLRLKTHIRELPDSGKIIDALRPVLFDWKSGDAPNTYGFIAQEVYKVFPQAVRVGDKDNPTKIINQWAMDASKFMPVVVSELQSLRARVKVLEDSPGRVKL